jgi:hypothetical protein
MEDYMKKLIFASMAALMSLSFSYGDIIKTFVPSDADIMDLDHNYIYSWNINAGALPANYTYTSAQLTFVNIRDWTQETNKLDIHLLPNPVALPITVSAGLSELYDAQAPTEYWDSKPGIELNTYYNLPPTPQTLTYTFDAAELAALNLYASDGSFGIGLDPDCHFFNDKIQLTLTAATPVPEPGILAMLGLSLLGFGFFIKRKKEK